MLDAETKDVLPGSDADVTNRRDDLLAIVAFSMATVLRRADDNDKVADLLSNVAKRFGVARDLHARQKTEILAQ